MPAANAIRDQTMDEILASIHRMIADGNAPGVAAAPARSQPAPESAAAAAPQLDDAEGTEDWMAEQVAAVLGETVRASVAAAVVPRESEPLEQRVGRRFVDGLTAGAEDVALIAADQKVETRMSEQQRATVSAVRPEAARGAADPSTRSTPPTGEGREEDRLLSEQANGSVGASFETLSRTILSQNPRTLEDLVRDLLRPMLRTWLDQNLPRMVERMVKQEIDRISRGER
jgi:cell pole-organizing protein PopZ